MQKYFYKNRSLPGSGSVELNQNHKPVDFVLIYHLLMLSAESLTQQICLHELGMLIAS